MTVLVSPLAISHKAPTTEGTLRCLSIHSAAINLLTKQEELLTIHNSGYGISPMGWSLKSDDFFAISQLLQKGQPIFQTKHQIQIGSTAIIQQRRIINLSMKSNDALSLKNLESNLQKIEAQTGLFGSLQHIIRSPLTPQLQGFTDAFLSTLQGNDVHWESFIGLGPGLTPSSDDMLVGMFAVAFSQPQLQHQLLQDIVIFNNSQKLSMLTTIISYNYLMHASNGLFSTPVLRVVKSSNHMNKLSLAIDQLLKHGHTSGADTLLGMWLGILTLNHYRVIKC